MRLRPARYHSNRKLELNPFVRVLKAEIYRQRITNSDSIQIFTHDDRPFLNFTSLFVHHMTRGGGRPLKKNDTFLRVGVLLTSKEACKSKRRVRVYNQFSKRNFDFFLSLCAVVLHDVSDSVSDSLLTVRLRCHCYTLQDDEEESDAPRVGAPRVWGCQEAAKQQ